ncbi:subclass B3 metallo-beta-lactamase [Sphingomonas sp. AR_OL41]|uniref:subclass B3 metallo-beta-lactamase n=1 Tax=Sphingomonas sp. AR_OL41 TaxID=3042729 RepID=UPI0024807617|nr:subclass B3 metallo-beta-lactamase [Sphingomonas sp. AR_OL41]MDH7974880.1 subclass B3 metallo-beta-lactamase [Sphingomonas sp. AR_OL41]
MFRTMLFIMGLAAVLIGSAAFPQEHADPLLRPVAPDRAARWLTPQAPIKVFGNAYLVGFAGLNVGLIKTDAGLVLIDGALPQAVGAIEANIRRLGFDPKQIRYILSTEPHFDHASGIAALARDSGATVIASVPAAKVLRQGHSDADDPQAAWLVPYPPVANVRAVRDGEKLRLGRTVITARATPGHTLGSMSWTWRSCEGRRCANMVFASSLNPLGADGYRFTDPAHAAILTAFRRTLVVMRNMPCDVLLTSHPEPSGGDEKYARFQRQPVPNPYIDPTACRSYADSSAQLLAKRLAGEAK